MVVKRMRAGQGYAGTLLRLGKLLQDMGKHRKARSNFDEAASVYSQIGDRPGLARAYLCLGDLRSCTNEPEKACIFFEQAMTISYRIKDLVGAPKAEMHLRNLNFQTNNPQIPYHSTTSHRAL